MRLINSHTLQIEEFTGRHPDYLILSHRWSDQEISYQEYTWLLNYDEEVKEGIIDELPPNQRARVVAKACALRQRTGYKKILDFAHHAQHLYMSRSLPSPFRVDTQHPYIWIDTCCINKESSAELSEAINSMYRWYQRANLCIAVLTDVNWFARDSASQFSESRWFTRGWTLQELRPRLNR